MEKNQSPLEFQKPRTLKTKIYNIDKDFERGSIMSWRNKAYSNPEINQERPWPEGIGRNKNIVMGEKLVSLGITKNLKKLCALEQSAV